MCTHCLAQQCSYGLRKGSRPGGGEDKALGLSNAQTNLRDSQLNLNRSQKYAQMSAAKIKAQSAARKFVATLFHARFHGISCRFLTQAKR